MRKHANVRNGIGRSRGWPWLLFAALWLPTVGCGDDVATVVSPDTPPPPAGSVAVSPDALSLSAGGTATVEVVVRDAEGGALTSEVEWSSSAPDVATAEFFVREGGGLVHRILAIGPGEATLTATAGTVSDSVVVTVTQ